MSTKRLFLVVLALVTGCQCRIMENLGADSIILAAQEPPKTAELDPQLELTRDALLDKGSSDQMRVNAAAVMLLSDNLLAREILLDALKQTENDAVRKAVCKALIRAGTVQQTAVQQTVSGVDDFIGPLLGVLAADNSATARLAAEATLIFDYDTISEPLDKLINDSYTPLSARLTAMYALELHPDVRAAITLLRLVDSPQKELAAKAEETLPALGISSGADAKARRQIIRDLVSGGQTAFLKKRLIRKEAQIRTVRAELTVWQDRYLLALGEVYTAISDDAERAKFLAGYLSSPEAVVRLWALDKIRQDRVGTRPNPKLPAEVGPVLVNLVSDQDRNIRLKTAGVLSFMTEVDSAQQLLGQLEVEQDDQIRTELFGALGRACYIAFLPDSMIKIAPEIRKQTLEWSLKYLSDETPAKVQRGVEVIRMLLEQDGLTDAEADRYLDMLAKRYGDLKSDSDGTLRGELLIAMSGLCSAQSVHRTQSRKLFAPLFDAALIDKTDSVREAAVDGLINIDKADALRQLRKEFVNDSSAIIRKKLIGLAAEVGGNEDLPWLAGRIGLNSESEPAWQAMLKIFGGADAAVLGDWVGTFVAENGGIQASDSQRITFLEIAERKAIAENKPTMLKNVQEKLAQLYTKTAQFDRAADYLRRLYDSAVTLDTKKAILPDLLYVYLRLPKVDLAAKLVENCLLRQDLDPNDAVARSLDDYLAKPPAGADPNVLLEALTKIKTPEARPLWRDRLREWITRFGKARAPGRLEPGGV